MPEKTLSSSTYKIYKIGLLLLVSVFLLGHLFSLLSSGNYLSAGLSALYLLIGGYYWLPNMFRFLKSFRKVSYSDQHLFIDDGQADIQVQLKKIKKVDLISMDGLYRFTLSDRLYFGDVVYCKPSIWYPFNYRRVDRELNYLRKLITACKKSGYDESEVSMLNSFNG